MVLFIVHFMACGLARINLDKDAQDETDDAASCPDGGSTGTDATDDALTSRAQIAGEPGTLLGFAVASAGHFDVNDYGDLLIGAPGYDPEDVMRVPPDGDTIGQAYLFYGPLESGYEAGASAVSVLVGETAGDGAGSSVGAADLNDDGYRDSIVGAPFGELSGVRSGIAYVAYGPHEATTSLAGAQRLTGESHGDWFGWQTAVADVTADDMPDLMVAAPMSGTDDAGSITVATGDSGGVVGDVTTVGAFVLKGAEHDMFGFALAVGDVDGDGMADVVGSAPRSGMDATEPSVVYVIDGPFNDDVAMPAGLPLFGEDNDSGFGRAVVLADMDDDGNRDVLVGAPADDATDTDAGAVYVFRGGERLGRTPYATVVGVDGGDGAGESVAALDADGDGAMDLAVGAPYADAETVRDVGVAYLVAGPVDGCVELATVGATYDGDMYGDRLGKRVANVGDIDNDGADDLAVSSPYASVTGVLSGIVYLFMAE